MRTVCMVFTILFSTVCLNILVLSQSNDKIPESDIKSSALGEDGEKNDYQDKVAVDPGGLPRDKNEDPPIVEQQKIQTEPEIALKDTKSTEEIEPEKNENIQTHQSEKGIKDIDQSPPLSQPVKESELDQSEDKKIAVETTVEKSGVTESTTESKDSGDNKQAKEAETPVSESLEAKVTSTETAENKATTENVKTTEKDTVDTTTASTTTTTTDEPKQQYPKQPVGHADRESNIEPKNELTNDTDELEKPKTKDTPSEDKPDDSELETFSEYWTKNVMEEEEKNKQSGDKPGPNGSVNKQTKRKQNNYASRECGAKILANNPEAENVRGILNSNKDDYMINPCKARKWFVIELCEPVRLSTVEIASFELFSSQPKHFYVGFSDRYPTKEWKTFGFDTKDERALQSFTIPEEDVYYKYVKVDITDHYGEEHFCPLTLFKVFGIAVEYDDDYNVPSEDDNDLDQAVLQTGEETADHQSPKNLFSSAKDTVMKIVKKVLNVEEKKEDINGTDTGNMTDKQINDTTKLNISNEGFLLPCVPEVGKPDITHTDPGQTDKKIQPNPPYHFTSTIPKDSKDQLDQQETVSHEFKVNLPEPSSTIVRKLEDHEQVPSEEKPEALVTLLDSETDAGSLHQKISNCLGENEKTNTTSDEKTRKSSNMTADLCAYVQIMMLNKIIHTCASQMIKPTKSAMTESSFILIDKTVTTEASYSTSSVSASEDSVQKPVEEIKTQSETDHKTTPIAKVTEPTTQIVEKDKITTATASIETSASTKTDKKSVESKVELSTSSVAMETQTKQKEIMSSPSSVFVTSASTDKLSKPAESLSPSSDSSIQDQITLEPSIMSSSVVVDIPQDTTPVLEGSSESYRMSTAESASLTKQTQTVETVSEQVQMDEQKTVSASQPSTEKTQTTSIEPTPSMDQKPELQFTDPPTQQGLAEQISTQQPVREQTEPVQEKKLNRTDEGQELSKPDLPIQRDLGLVRVPIMPFQKRDPIMRLNNRIKALELNVSLSSRFLDKMSQKFKRQSEDLMKTLNKTIGQFENVTREAEIREKKQKEQISVLEAQVENLTSIIARLTQKMDTIDKEVTDRQMVWTSIEVVILVIIFLICLRRGKSTQAEIPKEIQRLLETMPRQPDLSLNPRRNSFSAIEDRPAITTIGPAMQKYQSETTLLASTDMLDNKQIKFDPGGHTGVNDTGVNHQYKQMEYGKEAIKKKKKKKKSHDYNKSNVCESNESLTDINSAGLLFSAGGITPDSSNCDTMKRSSSHGFLSRLFWGADKPNENTKKVTIGPTTVAVGKPPKIPNHSASTGYIRNKRHSVDECGGSKAKRNGWISQSQSYTYGVHEVQKGKHIPNGNSSKFNDSKGQPNPYKGPMLNGKVAKHGQTKHVRGKSADFTPTDHEKSSGLWMNLIGRK